MEAGTISPWECQLCLESYDETHRRPRSLYCGHPFCSPCITSLIDNGQLTCPTCRVVHKVTRNTEFPINFGMEDVFRSLKSLQVTPVVTAKPVQDPSRAISKNLQALMLEQENDMKSRDPICQDLLQQMDEYDAELVKSQKDHEQILTRLNSLVKQNKLALQLQQEQRNIIQTMRKDFEEQRKQRNTIQECMTSVSTTQEALTAVEDLLSCLTGMKNWIQKCQELFPDVKAIHTSMKVREVSRMALDNVIMDDSSMEAIPVHLDTVIHEKEKSSTIMEKFKLITFSVEDLRQMGELVKGLLKAGRVMAVQEDKGDIRCSRMTLHNGMLHLHTLLKKPIPDNTYTLEHRSLVDLVDFSSTLVFLDLGWKGSTRGRIYIRLRPDTELARQFMWLSTGQKGPSFLHSCLLGKFNHGKYNEVLAGGDYEKNNGQGGATLLPGMDDCKEYKRAGKQGMVTSRYGSSSPSSAQFFIFTKDPSNYTLSNVFGQVEEGMEVVERVAASSYINEMKVVDCGVVPLNIGVII